MQLIHLVYVAALFVAAIGGALMTTYAQRHWKITAARPFTFLMACVAWWGFFAALSALAPTEEAAVFLGIQVRFSAVVFISSAGLLFTLAFRGWTHWLHSRRIILILAIPTLSLILNLTSAYHQLFVYDVSYQGVGDIWLREAWTQGFWFKYVYTPYSYLLLFITLLILIDQARQSRYPYRQQSYLLLFGALFPILASIPATFNLFRGPDYDIIVLGFLMMGSTFGWALSQFQLLDIVPIARSTIIENMTDPLLILDNDNRVVELNQSLSTRLNFSRRESLGKTLEELFVRWPELAARYRQLSEGKIVITVPANGRMYYFDVQISSIVKENKQVGRMIVWRDISEQKTTELALEASLSRMAQLTLIAESLSDFTNLSDLFQTIVDRVASVLPANRVSLIVFNQEAEAVTHFVAGGPGADMVLKVAYPELMDGLSGWVLQEKKAALSLKGMPDERESIVVQDRRQETDAGSIIVVPLIYFDQILGTMTAINKKAERDFTDTDVDFIQAMASQAAVAIENNRLYEAERKQVLELQESNEALEAFSHMVAHDLKSPLSIIVGYAELIVSFSHNQKLTIDEVLKYVGTMLNTGHKMSAIINELLMLANIRRNEELPLFPMNTSKIIDEVLVRLNWSIEKNGATIIKPNQWPTAVGYPSWIEEIWVNYVSNALKYGGERVEIELGFDENDEEILFWVKDNGPGLTAEEQSQLFKEFSRVGQHATKGHGLGLAIVRRIAERMGGQVGVESELGQGSKFYFTLPKADGEDEILIAESEPFIIGGE